MYFNTFGGSALLHLLAGYPRVVAAIGIAATAAMLASPLGPGKHPGSEAYLRAIDSQMSSRGDVDAAMIVQASEAAARLAQQPKKVVHEAVLETLRVCGSHCVELTPAIVENDPTLLRDALLVYQLEVFSHREQPGAGRSVIAQK